MSRLVKPNVGGKEKNKHTHKKIRAGRGPVGKTAVIGAKQRDGKIKAQPIERTDGLTLKTFVTQGVETMSTVYTDEHRGYLGLQGMFEHESVKHSVGEYVRDQAHTNGIESFWDLLKRGYHGTHHQHEREALAPLRERVCRASQHTGKRHNGSNGRHF